MSKKISRVDRTNIVNRTVCREAATVSNEGFGAMAALPRVDRFCYFRTLLARVENVLEAATAPSPRTLGVSVESSVEKVSRFEREVYFESEVEKKINE